MRAEGLGHLKISKDSTGNRTRNCATSRPISLNNSTSLIFVMEMKIIFHETETDILNVI